MAAVAPHASSAWLAVVLASHSGQEDVPDGSHTSPKSGPKQQGKVHVLSTPVSVLLLATEDRVGRGAALGGRDGPAHMTPRPTMGTARGGAPSASMAWANGPSGANVAAAPSDGPSRCAKAPRGWRRYRETRDWGRTLVRAGCTALSGAGTAATFTSLTHCPAWLSRSHPEPGHVVVRSGVALPAVATSVGVDGRGVGGGGPTGFGAVTAWGAFKLQLVAQPALVVSVPLVVAVPDGMSDGATGVAVGARACGATGGAVGGEAAGEVAPGLPGLPGLPPSLDLA